ncbi:MAG: hypothetical protein U1E05_05465 [Patescibacteria group bacterium]|nr:hypothetical protein [Patescibacteria group bacterium]
MITPTIQPLESYRLAQYALPIPCYVCETDNTLDAEACTRCQAPMALAHQAAIRDTAPRMIATMGAGGAGKTVYLGMLMDLLSHQLDQTRLLARGAFSITLQQSTVMALASCRFPGKTPNEPERWNWVHCQVQRRGQKQPLELIMPDMAGEAILEEVEHPHSYRVIGAFLKKCEGELILVDATRIEAGSRQEDYFAMKLLSHLSELIYSRRANRAKHPVGIVFTKADQCDACREDPAKFAEQHAPGLWQQCRERFPCHRFFASGVAGACATFDSASEGRVLAPLRVEPHGIIEPFLWLLDRLP